jgi:hypothetical protein
MICRAISVGLQVKARVLYLIFHETAARYLPCFVHGRCNNMIGRFIIQLLNIFSQIRFQAFNAIFLQERIQ